jgi:hypothetical protein
LLVTNALERFVRWVMRGTVYFGHHPAELVSENPDGSVDVRLTSDALQGRGLTGVKVRTLAGTTSANRKIGLGCLVTFDGGDPDKPSVVAWESAPETCATLLGDNPRGVARDGDSVEFEVSSIAPVLMVTIAGTGIPPGTPLSLLLTPVPPAIDLKITGKIIATSKTVLAV